MFSKYLYAKTKEASGNFFYAILDSYEVNFLKLHGIEFFIIECSTNKYLVNATQLNKFLSY